MEIKKFEHNNIEIIHYVGESNKNLELKKKLEIIRVKSLFYYYERPSKD